MRAHTVLSPVRLGPYTVGSVDPPYNSSGNDNVACENLTRQHSFDLSIVTVDLLLNAIRSVGTPMPSFHSCTVTTSV